MITGSTIAKKLTLSLGLVLISAAYTLSPRSTQPVTNAPTTPTQSYQAANDALLQTLSQIQAAGSAPTPTPAPTPVTTSPQPAMMTPMMGKRAKVFVDGSYTGSPADAYYGTVQVKAIISGGRITDVQFLQHPSDRQNSIYINDQAMPLLTQEAITAQSAQVDGVSGATFTSQAFQQSLASALVLAKN